jgi:hypothetical protein
MAGSLLPPPALNHLECGLFVSGEVPVTPTQRRLPKMCCSRRLEAKSVARTQSATILLFARTTPIHTTLTKPQLSLEPLWVPLIPPADAGRYASPYEL